MGSSKSKGPSNLSTTTDGQRQNNVNLSIIPARIDRVSISGLQRTKDDYIQQAITNCFNARTFSELLIEVNQTKNNLNELGIFKQLDVSVDISRGEKATPNGYDVIFRGKELARVTGGLGTEIGHQEGSLTAELMAPNIAGRGERATIHASYSSCKTTDVNLKLSKPFLHTKMAYYKPETSITLFKNSAQFPWYKYTTQDMGILLDYSFVLPTQLRHNLQYEYAIRDIGSVAKQVPFYIREHCGPRLASVLRHICTYDQRDSSVMPSRGIFFSMINEMSGFGGNIDYVKNTTHGEINIPLFGGLSAQWTGRVGILQADKLSPAVPLSSYFILGGPLTVRGFHMAGVGPHVDGVANGAHTFWASGLHLWSPLPFSRGLIADCVRVHGFTTVGNVNSFTLDRLRLSLGAGLAFKIGDRARIELNYCKPLWKEPTDSAQKEGFQFGIGYEFL